MSVELIRNVLRAAAVLSWCGGIIAALASAYSGQQAEAADMLRVAVLIAVITGTTAIVEVATMLAERIIGSMPAAHEVAARALLAGQRMAQEQYEDEADVRRISDFRSR